MIQPGDTTENAGPDPEELARRLTRGDAMLSSVTPILRHMLLHDDNALFSDEILSRVYGFLSHLNYQLLAAYAQADGVSNPEDYALNRADALTGHFCTDEALLTHVHALALEARLTERLGTRGIVDPVVPPLLQGLLAAQDERVAESAMAYLAAQARFLEQSRRMELPLLQLPAGYFDRALNMLAADFGDEGSASVGKAISDLRGAYSENNTRLGLARQIVAGLGQNARAALALDHSGASLFLTSIAIASDQKRETIAMACNDRRAVRLGLTLRAAGLQKRDIEAQFAYLEVDPSLAEDYEIVSRAQAAQMLVTAD